jgi:L-ascorbate metabolism protein UlaG (beta-lactamase superfamily)
MFDPATPWPETLPGVRAKVLDTRGVQYISHATVLIDVAGQRILTDPHWGERASPVDFAGPKRVRAPGVAIDELLRIDAVVVSHNHYDHLHVETLLELQRLYSPQFFVPLGDKGWLEAEGLRRVEELDWGAKRQLDTVELTFLPVKHWSARGLFDRNLSLWGGYLIAGGGKQIYFAGDTGYFDGFKDLAPRAIDLAILPIGAYEPRWFMESVHMNPEDAVLAHRDIAPKKSLGMHYGHWQLTNEGIEAPVLELHQAKTKHNIASDAFVAVDPGSILAL